MCDSAETEEIFRCSGHQILEAAQQTFYLPPVPPVARLVPASSFPCARRRFLPCGDFRFFQCLLLVVGLPSAILAPRSRVHHGRDQSERHDFPDPHPYSLVCNSS